MLKVRASLSDRAGSRPARLYALAPRLISNRNASPGRADHAHPSGRLRGRRVFRLLRPRGIVTVVTGSASYGADRRLRPMTETSEHISAAPPRSRRGRRAFTAPGAAVTVLVIVIVLALGGLAQTSVGRDALRDVGFYPHPTPFTQLHFERPAAIVGATALKRRRNAAHLRFVIRNDERRDWTYAWRAQASSSATGSTGRIALTSGSQETVATTVRYRCRGSRVRIVVSLAQPAQSIYYWVRCVEPVGGIRRSR